MSIIQGTSKSSAAGFSIDQSIRFNFSDGAHLLRTPSSASNRRTWTWSLWVKRSGLGNPGGPNQVHQLFGVGAGSCLRFTSTDALRLESPAGNHTFVTSQLFRDTSAWYHIVLAFDSTQATDTDRRKLYVNGSQVTDFSSTTFTGLAQNAEWDINSTSQHQIAKSNLADYFGGYLAELNFVDGSALAPTDFGETNADTGQWVPIAYTGSYGLNGFYITGANSADLGADDSGNGNDFTSSGLAAADQVSDSPTNNTATFNPLNRVTSGTFSDGNLQFAETGGSNSQHAKSTIGFTSGEKKVAEMEIVSGSSITFGICDEAFDAASNSFTGDSRGYVDNGKKSDGSGTQTTYGATYTTGDVIRIEVDLSSNPGTIEFFKDGVSQGDAFTDIDSTKTWFFWCRCKSDTIKANFGQLGFAGTPTTGFTAPTVANLPDPTIADPSAYFQISLWNGNGSTQTITQDGNSTFQPGWIWSKGRNNAQEHVVFDEVRGTTKYLKVSPAGTEATQSGVTAFNSDGFDLGSWAVTNGSGQTHVGWQWKAGGTSGSSNTDGSTTSTVSADTTSGFSIATYTGTGANATVGHGLGVAPSFVLVKSRNDTHDWYVWTPALATTEFLKLNSSAAPGTSSPEVWNSTAPTSSVVSLGTSIGVNRNTYNYVMYCFAEVEGFSKIGSYTGNGSTNGAFVYTGFKPAFVLWKQYTNLGTNSWAIRDAARNPFNVAATVLQPNNASSETTDVNGYGADLLSNGFKLRGTDGAQNKASSNYLYMAFAESPFKTATAR